MNGSDKGTLTIRPLTARLTHDTDTFTNMDPYVIFRIEPEERRTRVHNSGGKNPTWTDCIIFNVRPEPSKVLSVIVMDKDTFKKDDLVGECIIPLGTIFSNGIANGWFNLSYKGRHAGTINIEMKYSPPAGMNSNFPGARPGPTILANNVASYANQLSGGYTPPPPMFGGPNSARSTPLGQGELSPIPLFMPGGFGAGMTPPSSGSNYPSPPSPFNQNREMAGALKSMGLVSPFLLAMGPPSGPLQSPPPPRNPPGYY